MAIVSISVIAVFRQLDPAVAAHRRNRPRAVAQTAVGRAAVGSVVARFAGLDDLVAAHRRRCARAVAFAPQRSTAVGPVVADQEVDEGVPPAAVYWEGKVRQRGTYGGREIDQPGYVELTGYVQPEAIPWRASTDK